MKWERLPRSLRSPRQKMAAPFFSPGHSMTEPQPEEERFPKRDLLMAQGQYDQGELSSGPFPHVSASYLRMRMRRDAKSHSITVILVRFSLNFRLVPSYLLLVFLSIEDLALYHRSQVCCLKGHRSPRAKPTTSASQGVSLQHV